MLTNMKEELINAKNKKQAIPQFNINNLEWTRFILEECQKENYPVILGVSEGAIKYIGGYKTVVNIIKGLISDLGITIPVSIHLDHGSSKESCIKAIKAGFTSVMLDKSKENLDINIKETKELIELAHPNVLVEAEIGPIGSTNKNENYTNVEDCKKLIKTNIDTLAPAIGNKHGIYDGEVKLDYNLLEQLDKLNIPLVLHGASGIPDEDIKKCIGLGITKINFNTDLQIAWANEVRKYIENNKEVYDPRKIIKSGEEALKTIVRNKINLLNRQNHTK